MTTSNFPAAVVAAAQSSHKLYFPKGPYASVSLAQWALESNYGRAVSGKNNYFGIKATPSQISSGQATVRWTQEFENGAYHKVEQYFADYPDENGSFDAHAKLLATSPIYAEAQAATTPETYVRAMAKHYATAPNYADVILAVMKSQNLYQFDRPVQAATPVNHPTTVATASSPADRINAIQGALYQIEPSSVKEGWLARGEAWLAEHLGMETEHKQGTST